ncbi:TetR/AcrR family transcriptional regulator [Breznakia pachnodae]|uniref:AcrR family transcriptional regulator n=1 Tax=Breznakia pachnodae TaxID=265178 RepID=A0ABU0DZR8_9FIRM|nr:TetR/AcrR family transcriptional regulator [Breznakia pachnodae]MDQ0360127.1 AcrR family transcriptional regulator [Breznakia pachnodae]
MGIIKEPKQERSIEKRNKILEAGYKLILEKGYYNTNTAEIAKAAGVSSGIVYRYFKDKKDILLQAMQAHFEDLMYNRIFVQFENLTSKEEIPALLPSILQYFVEMHNYGLKEINELTALALLDDDVQEFMEYFRNRTCTVIEETMIRLGYGEEHTKEKAFMIWQLANHLCDDSVLVRHLNLDFDFIFQHSLEQIMDILECKGLEHTF